MEECPEEQVLSEDENSSPASPATTSSTPTTNSDTGRDSRPSAKRPRHSKTSQPSKEWAERQGVLEKIADAMQTDRQPNGAPEQFGQLLASYIRTLPEPSWVPFQMEVFAVYRRFYDASNAN